MPIHNCSRNNSIFIFTWRQRFRFNIKNTTFYLDDLKSFPPEPHRPRGESINQATRALEAHAAAHATHAIHIRHASTSLSGFLLLNHKRFRRQNEARNRSRILNR